MRIGLSIVSSRAMLLLHESKMKKIFHWIVLVFIVYALVELCSYGGLYVLGKYRNVPYEPADVLSQKHTDIIKRFVEQKTDYIVFSASLGWSIKEKGNSRLYQANSDGIRSDKEYALNPSPGILRVSTFGDSFTHCDDVNNKDTWQSIIENYDSNFEVLNFGVGGFGLDQAYLRYLQDGSRYKPHITLIGFMSENIFRNVNRFRPFYYPNTEMPLAKPRFLAVNNELSIVPNQFNKLHEYADLIRNPQKVLGKLGVNDYFFERRYRSNIFDWSPTVRIIEILIAKARDKLYTDGIITNGYYNANSEAFIITKRIFDAFRSEILNNDQVPIIVIFPTRDDVIRYQRDKTKRYAPLLSYFDSMNYEYIDLMDAVENSKIEDLFIGHYSPDGNRLIAKYLYEYLKKHV